MNCVVEHIEILGKSSSKDKMSHSSPSKTTHLSIFWSFVLQWALQQRLFPDRPLLLLLPALFWKDRSQNSQEKLKKTSAKVIFLVSQYRDECTLLYSNMMNLNGLSLTHFKFCTIHQASVVLDRNYVFQKAAWLSITESLMQIQISQHFLWLHWMCSFVGGMSLTAGEKQ